MPRLDRAGADFARALGAQANALWAFAVHAQPDALHVEDDVGDVLEHPRQRRKLVQNAFDLHRGDRGALQ